MDRQIVAPPNNVVLFSNKKNMGYQATEYMEEP